MKDKNYKNPIHGADINSEAKLYEIDPENIIDFSSNINPFEVDCMDKIIELGYKNLKKYPDINYRKLKKNISEYIKCEEKYIIPGNGATEIIYLLMRNIGNRLAIINPTFSEYRKSAKIAGIEIIDFTMNYNKNFELNLEEIEEKLDDFDSIFICNPNNPDGKLRNIDKLLEFAENNNKLLIVDETFIEFAEDEKERSLIYEIENNKNLFIIRAVTKFFGIPGIRLGYGITSNLELLNKMYEEKEPWTINSFADAATEFIFSDIEYIEKSKEYFFKERKFFINELKKIDGIKVFDSNSNFILIKFKDKEVLEVKKILLKRAGILIRDASNFIGLDNSFARVAIKNHKDNVLLIDAIKSVLGE